MAGKMKAFAPGGLEMLTNYIKDFRTDFETLVDRVNAALQEIGGVISEIDENQAYVDAKLPFSLTAGGWVSDSSGGSVAAKYPYKYTLVQSGISEDTRVDAVLDAVSASNAGNCGMCPVTETAANAIIFRCHAAPAVTLTGTLYVTQGETPADASGGAAEDTT